MTGKLDWEGRVGAEWADKADALDRLLGASGDAALAALAPAVGARVLDLGCGAGATSFALAGRVGPGGQVWGVDVSHDLLARAQDRQAARGDAADPVRFVLADASTWRPDAPLDGLYSRFGAMFFDDPQAAFANLRACMAPGAPLAIACWRKPSLNQWASLPMRLAGDLVPPSAPSAPGEPGPFAWAETEAFLPMLTAAGWRGVRATAFDHDTPIGAGDDPDPVARAVLFACRIGPLASRVLALPRDGREAVKARLAAGFAPLVRDGAVRVPASAWIVEATA
ncbi:MAG: SAM-dependent methyltransferase [Paracoccaceae bacterium]|jgi:SAM-dependent methyltransferase